MLFMSAEGTEPDPLEELSRELRETVGGEFRRSAEEDEQAARIMALRNRDLAHVAYELLSRGDLVRLTVGPASLRGAITHARGDLATLTTGEGVEIHINLHGPIALQVVERSAGGGRSRERFGPESFIARLRELELNHAPIEVLAGFVEVSPAGTIQAVAKDHLMVVGDTTHFVPIRQIGAVKRVRE